MVGVSPPPFGTYFMATKQFWVILQVFRPNYRKRKATKKERPARDATHRFTDI